MKKKNSAKLVDMTQSDGDVLIAGGCGFVGTLSAGCNCVAESRAFDPDVEHVVEVARVLDAIYGRTEESSK